jgi:hypothetical protein
LLDYVLAARRALLGLVEYFDGVHAPDCSVFLAFGRAASDATITAHIERGGVAHCSCGGFAVRQGARLHFNLAGERPRLCAYPTRRDTDRAPPPSPRSGRGGAN